MEEPKRRRMLGIEFLGCEMTASYESQLRRETPGSEGPIADSQKPKNTKQTKMNNANQTNQAPCVP